MSGSKRHRRFVSINRACNQTLITVVVVYMEYDALIYAQGELRRCGRI
jgi:hypothetical protein